MHVLNRNGFGNNKMGSRKKCGRCRGGEIRGKWRSNVNVAKETLSGIDHSESGCG